MPNLTPIALTEEERQKLTSIKHRLEANSWREMIMKLCDLYDEFCQAKQPITPTEQQQKTMVEKILDKRKYTVLKCIRCGKITKEWK